MCKLSITVYVLGQIMSVCHFGLANNIGSEVDKRVSLVAW
jgi:hypothetical protein